MKFLYLLHFEIPHYHAKHYLGSSENLYERLQAHADGDGACLTRALWEGDEDWILAALFTPRDKEDSVRRLERQAKKRHNSLAYCPLCNPGDWIPPVGTIAYPIPEVLTAAILRSKSCPKSTTLPKTASSETAKTARSNSPILLPE